jgi:hypothetical protein
MDPVRPLLLTRRDLACRSAWRLRLYLTAMALSVLWTGVDATADADKAAASHENAAAGKRYQ